MRILKPKSMARPLFIFTISELIFHKLVLIFIMCAPQKHVAIIDVASLFTFRKNFSQKETLFLKVKKKKILRQVYGKSVH